MSAPDPRAHTNAVLAHLIAGQPLEVGDGEAPADNVRPYLVLYPLAPAVIDGTLALDDVSSDMWLEWQVTSVGDTREMAEDAQSLARGAMATLPTPPAGRAFMGAPMIVSAGPAQRADEDQPPLYLAFDIYRIASTPA